MDDATQYAVTLRTSGQVGEVVGRLQNGGTVPAPVGEQFLADIDDLTSCSDDHRHQFQVSTAYQTLVLLQTDRPRLGTGSRSVPGRLPPTAAQRSIMHRYMFVDYFIHCGILR